VAHDFPPVREIGVKKEDRQSILFFVSKPLVENRSFSNKTL
jgi:hypothetical protein